ncbi:MAG: hypothetical protein RL151_1149 [Bacteroidota bacterium]
MVRMTTIPADRMEWKPQGGQRGETAWQEYMYRLVICPEGEAAERIRQLNDGESTKEQKPPLPSITLVAFRGREAMEDTIIRWVQRVCRMHRRFQVSLEHPRHHPAGGWRMSVTDTAALYQLSEKLSVIDDYINTCRMGPVHRETNYACRQEGVTIPANLTLKAGLEPDKPFASFMAHSLVLTRQAYAGSANEIVNLFAFLP